MDGKDAALARRWRQGDRDAAAEVADRYSDALGAVAYGILGDVSLSEDVVQETFVRAASSQNALRQDERLGGYLVGIARNVAVDVSRKRRREVQLGDNHRAVSDPGLDASRAELSEALRAAVDELPEDQRDLFLMKYVSNMRYAVIARVLGTSANAVGQKLWRIRTKLQEQLEDFRP